MTDRIKAGTATYRGDVTHIVGEVKGPRTYGDLVTATEATYSPATDSTRVTFSPATSDEIDALLTGGNEHA